MNHSNTNPPTYPNNRQALKQLEQEQAILTTRCYGVGALLMDGVASYPFATLGCLPSLGELLQKLRKTSQIYLTLERLLGEFESQDVIITPKLAVPEHGSLDLFVRFPTPPKKANFAIALRTKGHSKVVYYEEKAALFLRRHRGGLKQWQPDHLKRLPLQEFWLRNNQIELFGHSSKDKNRPLIKLLVLTGTAKLGQHPDHQYVQVGGERVLLIRRQSSTYILEECQLIGFINAWLAQMP